MIKQFYWRFLSAGKVWYYSSQAYDRGWIAIAVALKAINYFVYQSILCYQCKVERDVQLVHNGWGCATHPNVTIGRGVKLFHHVTLAAETLPGSDSRIVIEDNAVIGAYAIIIGNDQGGIRIGRGAIIGAGAIVNRDVPAGGAIIAMPSRPVKPQKVYEASIHS